MKNQTFDQIQHIAGIYANLSDSLPTGYICALNFLSVGLADIYIHREGTCDIVLKHSWQEGDTVRSFEAALEARIQNTPELSGGAEK